MAHKFGFLVIISVLLISCTSAEELLVSEHNSILHPDNAVLLYEHSFVASGATGDCASTFVKRWYRLDSEAINSEAINLEDFIGEQFTNKKWEYNGNIWLKKKDEGSFSASLQVFNKGDEINPFQIYYKLPISVVKSTKYATVYVLSINHLHPSSIKRCFGR